jgi:hypothetical protein
VAEVPLGRLGSVELAEVVEMMFANYCCGKVASLRTVSKML